MRPRARGMRKLVSVEPANPGFLWHLACGHTERKAHRPRGQTGAMCWACRRATATQPVTEDPNSVEVRQWRSEHGLCRACGSPAAEGKKTCAAHLAASKEAYWRKRTSPLATDKREGG